MNRTFYNRTVLRSEPVRGRGKRWVRIIPVLIIIAGLGVSLFSLFRKRNVIFHIQEMITHKKFDKAETLAADFHEEQPENVHVLQLMGLTYFMQGMKGDHWQVIKLDRDKGYSVDRLKQQGEEGWKLYKKAVESLKKAILLDKEGIVSSRDYMIIGFSYSRWGDSHFGRALKYLNLAYKKNMKDKHLSDSDLPAFSLESLYRQRGYLLYKIGKYRRAARDFQKANAIDRKVLNYLYIAHCGREAGDLKAAMENYRRVVDYSREPVIQSSSLNMLGGIYIKKRRLQEAERVFRRSISIHSNSATAYFGLSQVAEARGDRAAAGRYWDLTLKTDPHYGPAILKMRNSRRKWKR